MGAERCNGYRLGRFLRRAQVDAAEVDVIFCPGMGNGERHAVHAYGFWSTLRVWYRDWHTFARGGREFNHYRTEAAPRTHPGGLPELDAAKVQELKDMVSGRADDDIPVVFVGFSAGAYLAMTAARELLAEGIPRRRLGLVALGHSLFPSDRWEPSCDVPGIVIIGELEELYRPSLAELTLCTEEG